jgi:amino acid transporter
MTAPSIDARAYRAALHLLPPGFRREFSEQMIRDFDDARAEAVATGRSRELWAFRARMGLDLARAIPMQWLRTGLPIIAAAAILLTFGITSTLAAIFRPRSYNFPHGTPEADMLILEMLIVAVLFVIASTIVFTSVFVTRRLRRPRRR